jgi:hypothetical protein
VEVATAAAHAAQPPPAAEPEPGNGIDVFRLIELRNRLASALER